MLDVYRIRFSKEDVAQIDEYARSHACSKPAAIRALLALGHAHADIHGVQFSEAIQQVHARLADVTDGLDALSTAMSEMNDAYGKVWVETLMANRLLLDAHNRGLIDRARDMTTRYLERMGQL